MINLTLRENAVITFAELILIPEFDVNKLDKKLLELREVLEDWHEAVLLGETR